MNNTTTSMAAAGHHHLSSSKSRRNFHWPSSATSKVTAEDDLSHPTTTTHDHKKKNPKQLHLERIRKLSVSRLKTAVVAAFSNARSPPKKMIGTLFGHRKGHVAFVFQKEHNSAPFFFIELATPITALVNEMASGLVRIALECDKHEGEDDAVRPNSKKLLEEPVWRTYCNGKKCGSATRREPGPTELKILKTVEPISMGAGVLPGFNGAGLSGPSGELMYMRAKFERVVGSRDSEAFYMMNPDCNGAPELSVYLLRV